VHDPVGPLALRCPPSVEDEHLLHLDGLATVVHLTVLARGLPVPPRRGVVGPVAGAAPAPAPATLRTRRAKKYHWASRLWMREREGRSQGSRR
jgi:hypothetical protein